MEPQNLLKKQYQVAVFAGLAMAVSVLLYGVVVFLIGRSLGDREAMADPSLKYVLLGLAGAEILSIPFFRSLVLKRRAPGEPQGEQGWAPKLFSAAILSFSLSEIPAIIGVVVCVLTRNPGDYAVFALLSLSAFVLYFPRYSEWERRAATLD